MGKRQRERPRDGDNVMPLFEPLVTGTATQVSLDTGGSSDYVARIKTTADTHYRATLGLASSQLPELLFGNGASTPVTKIGYGAGAGDVQISGNGQTGVSSQLTVRSNIASTYGRIDVYADTNAEPKLVLQAPSGSGYPAIYFGGGSTGPETGLFREAAGTLTVSGGGNASILTLQPGSGSLTSTLKLYSGLNNVPHISLNTGTSTKGAIWVVRKVGVSTVSQGSSKANAQPMGPMGL